MTTSRSRICSPDRVTTHSSLTSGSTSSARAIPRSPEASLHYPADMGEWQAAVYLLTGCDQVWLALAQHVLGDVSIAPVINELEDRRRAWSSSEDAVMRWAAHFWDVDRWPAKFPYVFEMYYFRRWVTACHLYRRITPAVPSGTEGER
jgi:hypothetical protein